MGCLIVFCDACVLYPAPVRDLLMELALQDLFQPKWSNRIHEEWIGNLLKNRIDLTRAKLENTKNLMNEAILDCLVEGFEKLEENLNLPDTNDNHVLAAAIQSKATLIITYNLKDFPCSILGSYGIKAIHPDDFFCELIKKDAMRFILAIKNCHVKLKNPKQDLESYLSNLKEKSLLVKTIDFLLNNIAL